MEKGEIINYKNSENKVKIDFHIENETVWLSQLQICELFKKSKATISEHIKNVFKEGDLMKFQMSGNSEHLHLMKKSKA